MTPAHVITGSFGAGKTTAIRHLMANKPATELWVVILNEFTDAGIDVLSVAQSARGAAEVRLIAGGCLCCVGELEFGKQIRELLRDHRPDRLLIEPSGAGHAADIVDELALYEAQRALRLESVICLVDALDARRLLETRGSNEWSQIQSADVLLMSKADLAGDDERAAFAAIVAAQYPAKAFVAEMRAGVLPPEALHGYARAAQFSLLRDAETAPPRSQPFAIAGSSGVETLVHHLGLWAVSWILPRELTFARVILAQRLEWLTAAHQGWMRRLKGVFRTGRGPSWLVQCHGRGVAGEDSAYRRDSRLELVMESQPTEEFLTAWRSMLRDAALTPRA